MIKEVTTSKRRHLLFEERPAVALTCENCWTEQRSDRDLCYRCGTPFVFKNEQSAGSLT